MLSYAQGFMMVLCHVHACANGYHGTAVELDHVVLLRTPVMVHGGSASHACAVERSQHCLILHSVKNLRVHQGPKY